MLGMWFVGAVAGLAALVAAMCIADFAAHCARHVIESSDIDAVAATMLYSATAGYVHPDIFCLEQIFSVWSSRSALDLLLVASC